MSATPRGNATSGDGNVRTSLAATVTLAAASAMIAWFLITNRAIFPMWIEGFAEFEGILLVMLGMSSGDTRCWIHIAGTALPLAFSPYIGSLYEYTYLPAAYLWLKGVVDDPYVYRYTGFALFLASGWTFFAVVRRFFEPAFALLAALAFLTLPIHLLGSLFEWQQTFVAIVVLLAGSLSFIRFIQGGSVLNLLVALYCTGLTVIARSETFVWFVPPFVAYLLVVRPPQVVARWRRVRRQLLVSALGVVAFVLGAAPHVMFNLTCPDQGMIVFLRSRIFGVGSATMALPLWTKLSIRLSQLWLHNLLNVSEMWQLNIRHWVFAMLGLVAVTLVIARSRSRQSVGPLAVVLISALLLSVFVTGHLRADHLFVLEPLVLAVVVFVFGELSERRRALRVVGFGAVGVLVAANVAVSSANYRVWRNQPFSTYTMLHQSDPVLLTEYLLEHHRGKGDVIYYTNIGMPQYVEFASRGRITGKDIISWEGGEGFDAAVKVALLDSGTRRVFAAVARERDGAEGTLRRTTRLYDILRQRRLPYSTVMLRASNGRPMYELAIVEPGVGPQPSAVTRSERELRLLKVTSVREEATGKGGRAVIGELHGVGFRLGDHIVVDGRHVYPTYFGTSQFMSFSVPRESIEGNQFSIFVYRPKGDERSETQKGTVRND